MKSRFFILKLYLILSIPLLVSFQNEPDGFRGIKWGTDINTLKNNEFVFSVDGHTSIGNQRAKTMQYTRPKDEMNFGKAQLSFIGYDFCHGKFFSVHIYFDGYFNALRIKKALEMRYGKPDHRSGSIYRWNGKDVYVTFEKGSGFWNRFGFVLIKNRTIAERCIQEQKTH